MEHTLKHCKSAAGPEVDKKQSRIEISNHNITFKITQFGLKESLIFKYVDNLQGIQNSANNFWISFSPIVTVAVRIITV
jgi:hypothetical protein